MNIGRVLEEEYQDKKDGKTKKNKVLDLRTLDTRKRFTISLNKNKYPDGKTIATGQETKADFHIWYNFSNRGESLPSEIVGGFKKEKSKEGLNYLRGYIYDPSFAGGILWISAFEVDDTKKTQSNHTHNIAWSPPRRRDDGNYGQSQQVAQPNYYQGEVPIYIEEASAELGETIFEVYDDEIPF